MRKHLVFAVLLCALAAVLTGCSKSRTGGSASDSPDSTVSAKDHDAVVAAIQKHLSSDSGINMSAMDMTVNNVSVNGDQAQADAKFQLKQGSASMNISYKLERRAGEWVVLSNTPSGGGHSGSAPAGGGQPMPNATDYLKNHAPPANQ